MPFDFKEHLKEVLLNEEQIAGGQVLTEEYSSIKN